ncbi:MAG TPA: hypothetical protein VMF58_10985 [Rhizomicrobium sp.]|nr:hypothetical protein [Rhizomicrobium sp.]
MSRVWNSLRKAAGKDGQQSAVGAATQILRKLTGAEQFEQSEFKSFIHGLQDAGIAFVPIDEFVTRYEDYFGGGRRQRRQPKPDAKFGLLKFDIHGDIARPVEMARILNALGVHGLFLAMHRHALNDSWYGKPEMWDALKQIRDLGHEIGLHADPFHLITTENDLYDGMAKALDNFAKNGFELRTMTLHGDSRPHIKKTKLQANDFFADEYRKSKWDGVPPEGQEMLAEHVGEYKHKKLFRRCGIEYVADVNLVHEGRLIVESPMMYLSDNQRRLRIGHVEGMPKPERTVEAPELFRITPDFTAQAAAILAKRPFLALFHPQWYR